MQWGALNKEEEKVSALSAWEVHNHNWLNKRHSGVLKRSLANIQIFSAEL